MNITISERSAAQGTIQLGENVTCKRRTPITNEETELKDGDAIQETDYLEVKSAKTYPGIWKVNGEKLNGVSPTNPTEFFVEKAHFNSNILKIEFE